MMRHGAPVPLEPEALLATDVALALVRADMTVWSLAHPCECEALCVCDADE
jgi:hypothetical protein